MSGPAENGPSSEIARHLVTARHAAKDLLLTTVRRVAKAEALLIALRVVIVLRVRMVIVLRVRMVIGHRVVKVIVHRVVNAPHSVTGHLERKGVALAVVHPEATDRRLVTGLQEEIAHRVLKEEEVLGVAHRVQKVMVRHAVIVPRLVIVHQEVIVLLVAKAAVFLIAHREVIVPPEATRGHHAVIAQALATVRREVIVLREAPNVQPAEGQMAEVAIHEDHGVLPEADAVLVHRPEFMKELTRL